MNIGEVAQACGLPAKTIRYYEEIGLVSPERTANGYRHFPPAERHKLTFVARARSLGFTIESCRMLLALYEDPARASGDVRAIAERHVDRIDRKISELQGMRGTLRHLVERCHGDDRPECPILKDLANEPGTGR